MKTLLIALLLASTGAIAQDYYPYNQQYNYDHYDNYERFEQQRQLQQEFLDQQFSNSLHLDNLRQWRREAEQRERDKKW